MRHTLEIDMLGFVENKKEIDDVGLSLEVGHTISNV